MRRSPRVVALLVPVVLGASRLVTGTILPATAASAATVGDPASATPVPVQAAADLPICPDPEPPARSGGARGIDANVSVFVGGDYTVGSAAAESEGILAVGGTATFDKSAGGVFNVGVVGLGSQIVPPPGSDMLLAGGNAPVGATTTVDVGHGIGGNVVAGGTAGPETNYETSGGTITSGAADPLGRFAGFGDTIRARSASYTALLATGRTTLLYNTLSFIGDGSSTTQVFDVPGTALGTENDPVAMRFAGIPTGARIIVNVSGTTAQVYPAGFFTDASATQIGFDDPRFVELATHTMWNFPTATDVVVGTGDQLLGSVMVPRADASTTITASTNGRLLIGGDLLFDGDGNEAHAYPFPDDGFECEPPVDPEAPTGSLAVVKQVVDPAGVVDPARAYSGTYACTAADGAEIPGGSWRITAGGAPTLIATNLPVGATCSLTESSPPPPDPDDPSYAWDPPVISPATVTIGDGTTSTVTVTNTVHRDTGSFAIRKTLVDDTGAVDPTRSYSGTWTCRVAGAVVASGTWTVAAGAPAVTAGPAPVGAECTVDEDLSAPPTGSGGAVWDPPTITPSTVAIGSGTVPVVTVANHAVVVTGSFAIGKQVDGDVSGVPTGATFAFTWQCTEPGGAVLGPTDVRVAVGALVPVTGVPVGSSCTVTEGPRPDPVDPSYTWSDQPTWTVGDADAAAGTGSTTDAFTIPADGTVVRVGYVNTITRQVGSFAITKALLDPDGVSDVDETFHGTWSCSNDFGGTGTHVVDDGTWDVRADEGAVTVADDLPYGTSCNATEDLVVAPPAADRSRAYRWGAVTESANSVVIGDGGDPLSVVRITNVVDPVAIGSTIAKVVDDTTGELPAGTAYSGTVSCTPPVGTATTARWTVPAGAPPTTLLADIADGSVCEVAEDTPATPPDGTAWQPAVVSPSSFVAHAGSTVAVTVRNTLTPTTEPPTPPGPTPERPLPPEATGELAYSGSSPAAGLLIGLVLLGAGGAAVAYSRPRRRSSGPTSASRPRNSR